MRLTGRTAATASACERAWAPAPMIAATSASRRASRSVAAPLAAPVRSAVRKPPSIAATACPVAGSITMTTALMSGRLRSAFRLLTETTLTASDSEPLKYAGITNVTPSRSGCDNPIRSGTSARPVDSSMKARLTTSTASRIEMDRRTSDRVSSLIISDSFKVSFAFPIGHRRIERRLFGSKEMRVMFDHVFAERATGKFTRGKPVRGFGQRVGHAGQVFRGVNVAYEAFGRFDLVGDPVQSRSQRGGEREIGVAIGAGNSAFDAQ